MTGFHCVSKRSGADWPEWVSGCLLDDEAFADAYGVVQPGWRARMKTAIARLAHWYGDPRPLRSSSTADWSGGPGGISGSGEPGDAAFRSVQAEGPAGWTVILTDAGVAPAYLIGALMPALCAGAEKVLVVFLDDSAGQASARMGENGLLTALELAGQEDVAVMDSEKAKELCLSMIASPFSGVVAGLGSAGAGLAGGLQSGPRSRIWIPVLPESVGVWAGESDWDFAAVANVHSEKIEVWEDEPGPESRISGLPDRCSAITGTFEDFCDRGYSVVYVPEQAFGHIFGCGGPQLVLGPGQEGCWLWTDMPDGLFRFRNVGWSSCPST